MAILTIDQISDADDLQTKIVPIPAWGGEVEIRELTKKKQRDIRIAATDAETGVVDDHLVEMGIVIEAIIDPPMNMGHLAMLEQKNADCIDEVLVEVYKLGGTNKGAVAASRDEFPEGRGEVDDVLPGEGAGDDGEAAAAGDAVI